jgi:HTH domain
MDDLIRRKATGSADEFARKLGVSRRILMENLGDLKELGAPIEYDDCCKSYYYKGEFSLFLHNGDANKIRGGANYPRIVIEEFPNGGH